jgi:uncharacterized membrane protein (DUF373 family)
VVHLRDGAVDAHLAAQPLTGGAMGSQTGGEGQEERQRLADRILSVFEDIIYWAIAVMLVVGSAALLVSQFNTMLRLRNTPTNTIMLEILDGLLLIFIFVELLYAVRTSLRSHEIVVEPFLIVGMLAGIKEIVVLSVEAATLLPKGPEFSRAVVEIGVLGGVVLVLAVAAFILRDRSSRREDPGERVIEEEAAQAD